jgi:hypothetical protein
VNEVMQALMVISKQVAVSKKSAELAGAEGLTLALNSSDCEDGRSKRGWQRRIKLK